MELGLDDVEIEDVNLYDIWDVRECSITNESIWKEAHEEYKNTTEFKNGIPKLIHQIWIGSRQPPCVWLDTWRIDYMNDVKSEWEYILWDNDSVQQMSMLNREIFDTETKPQCQADILRLELLYKYGGVYIDADIVSTSRDLLPVIEETFEHGSGFMITYEPDTKEKPYSILGNSIIACTPKHPLILMLMSYIKQIYPLKRPFYGVEWVTGPLTYTKVLIHTDMDVYIPESKDFYPAFHYVPNPSAIDLTSLTSYCFQFGYTCSGLSQWVEQNNCCRNAHKCPYHCKVKYTLGKLRQFPTRAEYNHNTPKIIHQIYLRNDDCEHSPERWINTWKVQFRNKFPGYQYKLWTWDKLLCEIGQFYCANLYTPGKLTQHSVYLLALEIINAQGGYYIPLSTIYSGKSNGNPLEVVNNVEYKNGLIMSSVVEGCVKQIEKVYNEGMIASSVNSKETSQDVIQMGVLDNVCALTKFKKGSRFLGAGQVHLLDTSSNDQYEVCKRTIMSWAYDCQVPLHVHSDESIKESFTEMNKHMENRRIMILDSVEFANLSTLVNEIPGILHELESNRTEWDYVILNGEWETNYNGVETYVLSSSLKVPNTKYIGVIMNSGRPAKTLEEILLDYASQRVFVSSMKSCYDMKSSGIFNALPQLQHACSRVTHGQFEPNFHRDSEELMQGLFKGLLHHQVSFEIQSQGSSNSFMYRSWNNHSINCECQFSINLDGTNIESLRVFDNGHVTHDISNAIVSC